MAGARIICGSDRFDGSGLFGAMIPEELKGTQITEPVTMEEFSNIGTNAIVLPGSILRRGVSTISRKSLKRRYRRVGSVQRQSSSLLVKENRSN
jgi:hypothetical protein